MGYFPFYMDIEGKLCVIAGGGKVAYRKVCDLLPFGVCIRVIALDFNAELEALCKDTFRTPVYDKKRTGNCCYFQWRRKPRSYQTFKRPYETGAAGADRKYCRTAGKPEKRDFFPFSGSFHKESRCFYRTGRTGTGSGENFKGRSDPADHPEI